MESVQTGIFHFPLPFPPAIGRQTSTVKGRIIPICILKDSKRHIQVNTIFALRRFG